MSNYGINPVSRGVNNFFEGLSNSTNPTYIQPLPQQQPPCMVQQPTYTPTPIAPFVATSTSTYPVPTTMYTPQSLQSSYYPLNSNYNNAYYGK